MRSQTVAGDGDRRSARGTIDASADREDRPIGVALPNDGPVESLLGFGLFYVLVDRATPVVVDALADAAPALAPEPTTTVAALLLWLVFGLTALTMVLAQVRDNPRSFADPADGDAPLAVERPTIRDYRDHAERVVLGSVVVALAWPKAMTGFEALVVVVTDVGATVPSTLTPGTAAVFVAFFVGFGAAARGLDRLVMGGLREFVVRSSR